MAGNVNRVILVGNVGKDPETKTFPSGDSIVTFSLATSEQWRDKSSGERREKTTWHTIVVRNTRLVEVVKQYVKKGTSLYVEGSIDVRKWQDRQTGQDRYAHDIVLGQFNSALHVISGGVQRQKQGDGNGNGDWQEPRQPTRTDQRGNPIGGSTGGAGYAGDLDDQIPFGPEWR